jgi:CheY-like chemotaxis protein
MSDAVDILDREAIDVILLDLVMGLLLDYYRVRNGASPR